MSNVLFDKDIIRHDRVIPGQAGDGMSLPEYAALRNDLDDLLARPVIDGLDAIPDVTLTTPVEGEVLVRNAAGQWVNGTGTGTISEIRTGAAEDLVADDVSVIRTTNGLISVLEGPGRVRMEVAFAGSGSGTGVARHNHTHEIRADVSLRWSASGSHSSGTRTLTTGNITGLDPDKTYIVSGQASGHLRGEGAGAGYTLPRITIRGTARDAPDRPRTVAGVQVPFHLMHQGVSVSGVSSVSVSATLAYSEGDPVYVGGGELMISVTANR